MEASFKQDPRIASAQLTGSGTYLKWQAIVRDYESPTIGDEDPVAEEGSNLMLPNGNYTTLGNLGSSN